MSHDSDDHDLFKQAMGDVIPLHSSDSTLWLQPPLVHPVRDRQQEQQLDNPLTSGMLDILPCTSELEYKAEGVQQGVVDKLRQGKYRPEASLNLLRLNVEQCRQRLWLFILDAQQQQWRNLLIVHGKGRHDRSHANIVRSYLMRWLPQLDAVQAFCPARPQDGGSGACYLGLRKSEQARQENRERHAKHSR